MKNSRGMEMYSNVNRKMRHMMIYGVATASLAAGAYIGIKKIAQTMEDKKLGRYYEDEVEEILKEKERMKFYEDEFIRQEQEEKEELEEAVKEFNSKRLVREKCPHCGSRKRVKNRRKEDSNKKDLDKDNHIEEI